MRYTKLVLAFLGFAAVLAAADNFTGTWKMNPAKSKYESGMAPKEQTVTIMEEGDNLDIMVTGTSADSASFSRHYAVPTAGGAGQALQTGNYDGVSAKRMGPNSRETTYTKGGKAEMTIRSTISPDGKTMTSIVKGTDPEGHPIDAVVVYDKAE
jgi:hypothetical protein